MFLKAYTKEWLFLDIFSVSFRGSQPSFWITTKQPPHNTYGFVGQEPWIANIVIDNGIKDFLFIVSGKW